MEIRRLHIKRIRKNYKIQLVIKAESRISKAERIFERSEPERAGLKIFLGDE